MIRDFCRCLVRRNSLQDHELQYLYYRLGIKGSEYPALLTPTTGEAMEGLAILVGEHTACSETLITHLEWFALNLLTIEAVPQCKPVSWLQFIGAALLKQERANQLLEHYCQGLLGLEGHGQTEVALWSEAVRGLLRAGIKPTAELVDRVLHSPLFHLPAFLASVPPGSSVEELLSRHYGLLLDLLNATDSLSLDIARDYLQAIHAFLVQASSFEAFLVVLMQRCLELLSTDIDLIHPWLIQPKISHGALLQSLLPALAMTRVRLCASGDPAQLLSALNDLKEANAWLVLHPHPDYQLERLASHLGQAMGAALHLLAQLDRQASMAFVANITSLASRESPLKHEQAVVVIAAVLGSVACTVNDDQVSSPPPVLTRHSWSSPASPPSSPSTSSLDSYPLGPSWSNSIGWRWLAVPPT